MAIQYDEKIIISGFHVERYLYLDKYVIKNYERRKRKPKDADKPQTSKSKFSTNRTRQKIRRLINANPHLSTFLTLTFNQAVLELDQSNPIFMMFVQRMKYKNPNFQYIAIVEFQKKSKRVHYHLLCNYSIADFKSNYQRKKFERWFANKYWKKGFIKIKDTFNIENLGIYMCKYLSKDMTDSRLFSKKKFFCSRDLNQPKELINYEANKFITTHGLDKIEPKFKTQFSNEFMGRVDYYAYKLDQSIYFGPFLILSKNRVNW